MNLALVTDDKGSDIRLSDIKLMQLVFLAKITALKEEDKSLFSAVETVPLPPTTKDGNHDNHGSYNYN